MTDEATELRLLRGLRKAVEDMCESSLMLFTANTKPGQASHLGYRVEVPIKQWDDLMDAVGDLEGFDGDPEAYR